MEDGWKILEAAPITLEASYKEHMTAFVENFVDKKRQDRWLYLLLDRPKSVFKNSHKLYNDLNRRYCSLANDVTGISLKQVGVYYDFYLEPRNLTMEETLEIGTAGDALFSIRPGHLALYLFHESEIWLCQKR